MLNIISDKMKTIFEGQLTILPVSLVPQVADMDETVVRVIRSPLKSQQCHFGSRSSTWGARDGATYEATRRF